MNSSIKRGFSRLYIQISAIFLVILIIYAGISLFVSINSASKYSVEVNQKLNWDLAKNTVDAIKPEFKNGEVNEEAIADIMHSMMVINPSVEVYLLNPDGKILKYVAPEKVVKLQKVSLDPILEFLKDERHSHIFGDDPRNPGEQKTFSAAEVIDENVLTGYIYIVLASQEYVSTAQMVIGSYILGLSIRYIVAILLGASLVGLLALYFITKKLRVIVRGIEQFQSGDMSARVLVRNNNELDTIGHAFNNMAKTISKNITELKDTDEFRKELISNVSHDLRTPVASIQGYAETMILKKDRITQQEQQSYLQIIYDSCEKLKKLVGELFELSKLQTNQVKLKPEPFSIADLVSDIANKYRIISQKKGISINTFLPRETTMVEADLLLIDRVLQNLIDNAIKFCKDGDTINIDIRAFDKEHMSVSIIDSGAGISQEELPHIFDRFFKGNKHGDSTGLGLAIVKKIIDLHHTEIMVKSQIGKGTAFTFTLPLIKAA